MLIVAIVPGYFRPDNLGPLENSITARVCIAGNVSQKIKAGS
jgi:hypothetical protein